MKRNEIGLRQLHVRRQHQRPRDKALRLSDVKAMFLEMRDPAPPITEMTGEPFKSQFTAEDGCQSERVAQAELASNKLGVGEVKCGNALGRDTWPEARIDADGVDRGKL